MKICVLGSGYVGLVAGAGFADMGNDVICCDIDADKIASLRAGVLPIYEPGLEPLVQRNLKEGRLAFSTEIESAVSGTDVVFVAVGTPPGAAGDADLSQIFSAGAAIGRGLRGFTVIAIKSTVPVGTAETLSQVIGQQTREPFAVVSNPEFLKEGDAVNDFMKPDRVIVGTSDARARDVLRHLYAPFVRTSDRLLFMDNRSAELTKYAANTLLATRISFMNEMAGLCEKLGADIDLVRRGMGSDPRIGAKFLFPGPGYGGSCFPKDLRALTATARAAGASLEIAEAVHRVNQHQKQVVGEKIAAHFGGQPAGRRVAVWGLAFKAGTDDVRESPALALIDRLLAAGATVSAYDPAAARAAQQLYGQRIRIHASSYECIEGADALALMTEWHEFRRPNFERMRKLMAQPVLFDGRNLWEPEYVRALGFTYYGIGRR
ncbi:MAG TPA: UDP-glucose/GDP-mannose dehydrogenase family protein [Polyangia bacterium]|nr:UDP-glucose/GDP-mannose dehydrogenase family protein [Polyangia bacterium]